MLKRHHIPAAPQRKRKSSTWRSFLGHYADHMLGCDFFTVETTRLKILYILFFIELGTRRVHLTGCTAHPTSEWVTQQARKLMEDLRGIGDTQDSRDGDLPTPIRFLIHDRDTRFTSSFDVVFNSEGVESMLTPYRCPKANAFAERWVRTVREECLDRVLIISQAHLRRVLQEYIRYYNHRRPHQGIDQQIPIPRSLRQEGTVKRRDISRKEVLGGIIHDYYRNECDGRDNSQAA